MKRYIPFGKSVEELNQGEDGLWRDSQGTVWAFSEDKNSVDPVTRCGIGFFSLPEGSVINAGCRVHDYLYSSPTYQAYHTREEADEVLRQQLIKLKYPIIGRLFYRLSRLFGGKYWENKKTNN